MFDSIAYMAATRPPEFIAVDGTRFIGRLLSVDEWQPYEVRMQAASRGELAWPALRDLLRDLTREFFPRGFAFWRRRFWRPCWWYVNRLPPVGQLRAVYSFMQSQGTALGMEPPTLGPKTLMLLGIAAPGAGSPGAGS